MFKIILLPDAIKFIDSLVPKMYAKTLRGIDLLENFGYELTEPHSKFLQQYDLHELRIKFASNIVRLFYFLYKDKIYVITSGFKKKQKKTDRKEIAKALKLKKQFMEDDNAGH